MSELVYFRILDYLYVTHNSETNPKFFHTPKLQTSHEVPDLLVCRTLHSFADKVNLNLRKKLVY